MSKQYIYRVVTNGRDVIDYSGSEALLSDMERRGFAQNGVCEKRSVREELRGQPQFSGLTGPFWGGMLNFDGSYNFDGAGTPCIRYEDPQTYDHLST